MAVIVRKSVEPRYVPDIHLLPEDEKFFITREPRPYTLPRYDPEEFPKRVQFTSAHKTIPDFVPIHGRLSVSPEAKALIEEFEPGIHQFLPVEIERRRSTRPIYRLDGRVLDTPYYVFFPQVMLDAVWVERSEVAVRPRLHGPPSVNPKSSRDLDKLVLHREIVAGHHVWRGHYQCHMDLFFSNALAHEIEKRRLRKLNFVPLQEA
ncbi:hypothetical protein GWK16_24495 [Roseomonas sp. JC162]|uniref:Immunity MXAN-0049 protein domain-containing protein n=1 Tax=Neoroseomonas marina TaxID=1232220 RepID=A0A848EM35_9PROT|nr:DUF1629 domain-containing protein [Neoroseomonas marina]NMJ44427.1 hypothetical protein [Neoroseomonas marina]